MCVLSGKEYFTILYNTLLDESTDLICCVMISRTTSVVMMDPRQRNMSAVGYSGVLFCYATIEAFHSEEQSRSVFGLFTVPTKLYPFILLVIIQVSYNILQLTELR